MSSIKEIQVLGSQKFGGEYTFGEVLGKGAQSTVYKFIKDTGEIYATKKTSIKDYLCTDNEELNTKRWRAIIREAVILERPAAGFAGGVGRSAAEACWRRAAAAMSDVRYEAQTHRRAELRDERAAAGRETRLQTCDATTLFKYSAVTHNAHRIHYDSGWATEQEGFPAVVVHGPLLQHAMLGYAREALASGAPSAEGAGRRVSSFSMRAIAPSWCAEPLTITGGADPAHGGGAGPRPPAGGGYAPRVVRPAEGRVDLGGLAVFLA